MAEDRAMGDAQPGVRLCVTKSADGCQAAGNVRSCARRRRRSDQSVGARGEWQAMTPVTAALGGLAAGAVGTVALSGLARVLPGMDFGPRADESEEGHERGGG